MKYLFSNEQLSKLMHDALILRDANVARGLNNEDAIHVSVVEIMNRLRLEFDGYMETQEPSFLTAERME